MAVSDILAIHTYLLVEFQGFCFFEAPCFLTQWLQSLLKRFICQIYLVKSRKCKPLALAIFLTSHVYIYIIKYLLRSLLKNTILSLIDQWAPNDYKFELI